MACAACRGAGAVRRLGQLSRTPPTASSTRSSRTASSSAAAAESLVRGEDAAAAPADTAPVKSYAEVPGPKPIPFLGNSWRFLPVVGESPSRSTPSLVSCP